MKTIVITSWYFNPVHPGHIECFELCKELWDELRVIVNNDIQALQKTQKSEIFQDQNFRMKVVSSLKPVDEVFLSVDQDGSVCESIKAIAKKIREKYGEETKIIFWKGGDRFVGNIPEVQVCRDLQIVIRDGLWKKIDSSCIYRDKSGKENTEQ